MGPHGTRGGQMSVWPQSSFHELYLARRPGWRESRGERGYLCTEGDSGMAFLRKRLLSPVLTDESEFRVNGKGEGRRKGVSGRGTRVGGKGLTEGRRAGPSREGGTKVLTEHVCSPLSSRRSGQGGATPASAVNYPGGLGGHMVQGLRGHQAALLLVHCPQVRGGAGWTLHPSDLSVWSPGAQDKPLSQQGHSQKHMRWGTSQSPGVSSESLFSLPHRCSVPQFPLGG